LISAEGIHDLDEIAHQLDLANEARLPGLIGLPSPGIRALGHAGHLLGRVPVALRGLLIARLENLQGLVHPFGLGGGYRGAHRLHGIVERPAAL